MMELKTITASKYNARFLDTRVRGLFLEQFINILVPSIEIACIFCPGIVSYFMYFQCFGKLGTSLK